MHGEEAEEGAGGAVHEVDRAARCASEATEPELGSPDVAGRVEDVRQPQEEVGDARLPLVEAVLGAASSPHRACDPAGRGAGRVCIALLPGLAREGGQEEADAGGTGVEVGAVAGVRAPLQPSLPAQATAPVLGRVAEGVPDVTGERQGVRRGHLR